MNENQQNMELHTLQIQRDNTTDQVEVFAHEVDLMKAIHGPDNVLDLGTVDRVVEDFDPDTELQRLLRKYGKNGEPKVREILGSNGDVIAQINGISRSKRGGYAGNAQANEGALSIDHSKGQGNTTGLAKVASVLTPEQAQQKAAADKAAKAGDTETPAGRRSASQAVADAANASKAAKADKPTDGPKPAKKAAAKKATTGKAAKAKPGTTST